LYYCFLISENQIIFVYTIPVYNSTNVLIYVFVGYTIKTADLLHKNYLLLEK